MFVTVTGTLRVSRLPVNRLFTDEELVREKLVVREERNLLVNLGLQVFSRQLGGNVGAPTIGGSTFGSISDLVVTRMLLGNASSPAAPVTTDTTGVTAVLFEPSLVVTYPTDYSVRFTGIMPTTEGNGSTITEEALYLSNGMVFAKRVLSPGEIKDSSVALQFDHEFSFNRA